MTDCTMMLIAMTEVLNQPLCVVMGSLSHTRDRCSCRNSTIFSIYYNYSALKSWISEGWGTARDIFCYCAIRMPLNKKGSRERVAFSAKFAQQPLMIRVTNAKLRMMSNSAEKRKHGEMLSNSLRATICDPLICGKTNVFRSLLESIRFENICSKSLQPSINISKIYLRSPTLFHWARRVQILFLSLMTWHATSNCDKRILLDRSLTSTVSIYVRRMWGSKRLICDNANLLILFKQD